MDKNFDYVCYFDGACGPINPGGNIGTGAIILKGDDPIYENSGYVDAQDFDYMGTSNNIAEYMALIDVLKKLIDLGLTSKKILVRGDSNLVINQMRRLWKAKGGRYKPYYDEAMELAKSFEDIKFRWIPREQNAFADDLSKRMF